MGFIVILLIGGECPETSLDGDASGVLFFVLTTGNKAGAGSRRPLCARPFAGLSVPGT